MVAWAMFAAARIQVIRGQLKTYASSEHGRRSFCPDCGTGLFYENAKTLPGIIDVQSATLDDPDALPPRLRVQMAERLAWLDGIADLPAHDRYPTS